ncbi:MAG: hypothetical protein D6699_02960 [Aquificota bacterium]|nr:MAG: hypothetical protein D6699_02960 [Aquificota bacterium]
MPLAFMVWGRENTEGFYPLRVFWLLKEPHPHWVETSKDNLKMDFKETGFRQFLSLSSPYLITDAMLMFGLEYAKEKDKLIESLNPIRLTVRAKPGSYTGISHHFLGAPFELEGDDLHRAFLNEARQRLEEGGFELDVLVVCHNPYIEDLLLENLRRINQLNFKFYGV